MEASDAPTARAIEVLSRVQEKGVKLWVENGQLRYRAPKGTLTQSEIDRIQVSKSQIVDLLGAGKSTEFPGAQRDPRVSLRYAPLSFSQLGYLHDYQLHGEPYQGRSVRLVASAFRLHGRLDVAIFRQSVAEIIRRHDALRTRLVVRNGVHCQEIDEELPYEVQVEDLTTMSAELRECEVERQIRMSILEPVDVAVGPLFGIRLLKVHADEHLLLLSMEHMISDGTSLHILARDLLTAYMQFATGGTLRLPFIPMQFPEYAMWQRRTEKAWLQKHGPYWRQRLATDLLLRFPDSSVKEIGCEVGWGAISVRIERDLKVQLLEWSRAKRTTIVMALFTAYVALLLRWCDASELVVQYQCNARVTPKVENAIGFFTSALRVCIKVGEDNTLIELMNRVVHEYCEAYEHLDFSYLAAQDRNSAYKRSPSFNWTPRGTRIELGGFGSSESAITYVPHRFPSPTLSKLQLDCDPVLQLYDTDEEIAGNVFFPLTRFTTAMMERFYSNLFVLFRALLTKPEAPIKSVALI